MATPEALTFTEGANATVADGTGVAVLPSASQGKVPIVSLGYVDGSNAVQPLGDVDGIPVYGVTSFEDVGGSDTASRATVNDTSSSTTLLASNALRKGWRIKNTSSAVLHIAYGGTASATNCIESLAQNAFAGDAGIGIYTGDITGVWASDPGDGVAVVTAW